MITVEELIVQSLYHRLVVVHVRRTNDGPQQQSATPDGQSQSDSGAPSDASPDEGSTQGAWTPTGPAGSTTLGPGLGILYMGAMSQKVRSTLINKTVQQCLEASNKPALKAAPPGESNDAQTPKMSAESQALIQSLQAKGEEVQFSREVKTVLETSEMTLMRAALVTEGTQTEAGQVWHFGPSTGLGNPDQEDEENEEVNSLSGVIDLRNCDQFSIVKFEDKRDPKSKSLVMVQTNEIGTRSAEERRPHELSSPTKSHLQASPPSTLSLEPSPISSPTMSNNHMAVYVKNNKGQPRSLLQGAEGGAQDRDPHDLDSGIWDMVKGKESSKTSTRESTPIVHPTCSRVQQADPRASDNSLLQADVSEPCMSPVHMMGSFKAFSVEDKEKAEECGSSVENDMPIEESRKPPQNPDAEVKFTIHNEERHLERRDMSTETFSSDQFETAPQSLIQSPDEVPGGYERTHIVTHGASLTDTARLTAALEAFPFDRAIPSSPEPDPDSVSIPESDVTIEITDDSTPERGMGLNDFMVARERGVIASRSQIEQRTSTRHSFIHGTDRSDDFSGLNDIEATRQRGVVIRRIQSPPTLRSQQAKARHTRGQGHSHRDSGILSAPQSLSPGGSTVVYRSRGSDDMSLGSMDSSFLSEFGDFEDSSICDSDALELSDVPDFERFANWMSELPERLKTVPLGSLVIPGSHIALAIDREMRFDMDFSKCNYEMAEFLRKLPNLSIFNNFRTLMKKIWRAWMPKQMLGIYHQLEAGSRYFDIRITKYRSAFYGEHGLYTRQFKKYLKDIKMFMDERPTEIIILHFQQLDQLERADKRRLVTVLFQVFGAKMARATDLQYVSLKWLWDNKKQVIIFFPSADIPVIRNHIFAGLIWSDDMLHTTLPKKQTVPDLIDFLESSYATMNESKRKKKGEKMYVTKAVLSPDMTMVFGEFQFKSMRELTQCETLDALLEWLQGKNGLNIVAVDFVGCPHLVRTILSLNGRGVVRDKPMETVV